MPAVGMPKLDGFPQVCAGCAACGCFWLNDSEEVRLDKHAMDVDTAEALAGVVGLLRQAALRAWAATDPVGARSPGQLFGVDLAADQARHLVPDVIDIDVPVPVDGEPAGPADVGGASVGVLMASLDFYHLDLVVAVLWHAGSGGSTRNSSNDSGGQWL
jgi:hypothetical protein